MCVVFNVSAKGNKTNVSAKGNKTNVSAKGNKTNVSAKGNKTYVSTKGNKTNVSAKENNTNVSAKGNKTNVSAKGNKTNVSAKGNKTSNNSKMHIHFKWIDYPSKREASDWNQRRREEHTSNEIEIQFFICAFWTHISSCFSHQKSVRRTSNQVKLDELVP